jgi:hypothetical protein
MLYYAQYTHQHPVFGALLRVHNIRTKPSAYVDLDQVVEKPIRLSAFYPLERSLREGIFHVVGNRLPSRQSAAFPIFRDGHVDPKTGKVAEWWLWDGEREWFVGPLANPEQYPLRQVVNDTLLRELVQDCVE